MIMSDMYDCVTNVPSLWSRRSILRVGSLGLGGLTLSQFLRLQDAMGADQARSGKAQSVIMLFLNGGPSQVDTWDPKGNSSFKPISTNVPGIQISELLPRMSRRMDKMAIIRTMRTEENNHGIAHHYVMTGHRPSPAMKFPSFGSIISNELGEKRSVPPYVMVPGIGAGWLEHFRAHMLGARYDPMVIPDPSLQGFKIPDLSLPPNVTVERIQQRRAMSRLVDEMYREQVVNAEHAKLDTFQEQALNMILSPAVREAFDLSRESDKLKDAYGRTTVGMSALIARWIVDAGSSYVTVIDLNRPEGGN